MRCPPADAQRGVQQLVHLVVGIGSQRGDDGRADVGDAGDADVVPVVAHHAVAPEEGGVDANAAGRRGQYPVYLLLLSGTPERLLSGSLPSKLTEQRIYHLGLGKR